MFVITKNKIINLDKVCYIRIDDKENALYFYFETCEMITFTSSNIYKAYQAIENNIVYNNPFVSIAEFED